MGLEQGAAGDRVTLVVTLVTTVASYKDGY